MFLFLRRHRRRSQHPSRKKRWMLIVFILLAISTFIVTFGISYYMIYTSSPSIYSQDTVPNGGIALVFGAAVYRNGNVTSILQDRLDTAYELFTIGKVQKIIVSGDNSSLEHNEVTPMQQYLIQKGIPASHVYPDFAGFDTYDSLYRAHNVFGSSSLTLITQEYHLYRALFLCKHLRMTCYGVPADKQKYARMTQFLFREYLARIKALYNILQESRPKYLGIPIDLSAPSGFTETK